MSTLLHVLQHALGRDQFGQRKPHLTEDYRNHYVAGEGHHSRHLCDEAVRLGLMERNSASDLSGGDKWFHVTKAGVEYVDTNSPKPPKLPARKQRYQEWLRVSDATNETFIEFLKRRSAERRAGREHESNS